MAGEDTRSGKTPWATCYLICVNRDRGARVIAIAHNARGFDVQFILHIAIVPKRTTELILKCQKIISMTIHNVTFLDSISFMPMALRKLPEAFGLSATKSWYLNYVGSIPDTSQYGVAEMSESDREEFTSWYDVQKHKVFDNRRVLEQYCQDDVTVFVRRVSYSVGISWMSETWIFSSSLAPSRQHVSRCCASGS